MAQKMHCEPLSIIVMKNESRRCFCSQQLVTKVRRRIGFVGTKSGQDQAPLYGGHLRAALRGGDRAPQQAAQTRLGGRRRIFYGPQNPSERLFILQKGKVRIFRSTPDGREFTLAVVDPAPSSGRWRSGPLRTLSAVPGWPMPGATLVVAGLPLEERERNQVLKAAGYQA